jgi:hypothetical protein
MQFKKAVHISFKINQLVYMCSRSSEVTIVDSSDGIFASSLEQAVKIKPNPNKTATQ